MFKIFYVFITRQAHLHPKVPKQANFRISLQNSLAEMESCSNFLTLRCDKAIHEREPFFGSNVQVHHAEHNFTLPLEKLLHL